MTQYNKVTICETKCKTKKSDITDISTYKKELKKFTIPSELVGEINQLVKPYFDIDTELPQNTQFDEQAVLVSATEKIKKLFKLPNSKDIYILKRDSREKNGKYKYSYHIVVDNICITNFNIKKLLDDAKITDFDTGVYDKNRALHPIIHLVKLIRKLILLMFQSSNHMMFSKIILKKLILLNIVLHILQKVCQLGC